MSKSSFLKQFFKQKKMVGSIAPSSRFLSAKMLNHLPLKQAKFIVELGPGNGVFTEKILAKMGDDSQLLVIELNEEFHKALSTKITHPNFNLFHDSADQLGVLLQKMGGDKADIIISSLPLANFPIDLRDSLLDIIQTYLKDDGYFVQFQYSLQAKKYIKKRFPSTKINFTPLNLPPAFVYSCQKTA
jgi:phospholipid N-methyltransferase